MSGLQIPVEDVKSRDVKPPRDSGIESVNLTDGDKEQLRSKGQLVLFWVFGGLHEMWQQAFLLETSP